MELTNQFDVPVPVDQAWDVLLDVPRVARCLPGATLDEGDGESETYRGQLKIKIGSITAAYRGEASIAVTDPDRHTAKVTASGREQRGAGRASAEVCMRLLDEGEHTRVEVSTELSITGKAAQFGRGILADVSGRLIDEFATNLAGTLTGPTESSAVSEQTVSESDLQSTAGAEPFELLSVAHQARIRRYVQVGLASGAVLVVGLLTRRAVGRR